MRTFILSAMLAFGVLGCAATSHDARISAPGQYSGWSSELYSEWVRTTDYVAVRDGTRLALTLYRPAINGRAVETPYPVALEITPYRARFRDQNGAIQSQAEQAQAGQRPMVDLTRYGYVVAVLD